MTHKHRKILSLRHDYLALNDTDQIQFLARFSHQLTITMRGAYEVGTDSLKDPVWARRVNEIQHRVAGHLLNLLIKNQRRYSEEALLDIIFCHQGEPLNHSIAWAFSRSLELTHTFSTRTN